MQESEFEIALSDCTVLGGAGLGLTDGEILRLTFTQRGIRITSADDLSVELALPEVVEVGISGPGTVVKGGGFTGGGFGAAGAMEGIGVAMILNALTTKQTIHSFLTMVTHVGELHLHYGGLEPGALRMTLAPFFVAMRRMDPIWFDTRSNLLRRLVERGSLSEADADGLERRLRQGHITKSGSRMGRCPACTKLIPLASSECPECTASFGAGAAWKVLPVR